MTDASGIGKFYGAAIHLLRWWVRRWKREDVATGAGISVATLDNYERGKTAPGPKRRQRIAAALDVSPAVLDGLAGAVFGCILSYRSTISLVTSTAFDAYSTGVFGLLTSRITA